MLETLRNPKSFIVKTGTIIGGAYAIRGYMRERLEEAREQMEEERQASEMLRARFSQTQEDVAYTVLALLPTLASQVLQDMDVDALTRELQARSKARSARTALTAPRPVSSLGSSIVQVSAYPPSPYPPIHGETEVDARSDVESVTHSSEAGSEVAYHTAQSASFVSTSNSVTQSWIIDSERSRSPAASAISNDVSEAGMEERMSESILSIATTSNSDSSDSRTKAELWNELKMLTFTRTLTTLYASTLLSLLTTLQLTLLARGKYVSSVLQAEKQERLEENMRERMERELNPANLLIRGATSWVGSLMGVRSSQSQDGIEALLGSLGSLNADDDDTEGTERSDDTVEGGIWLGEINDELENKYLTMSWWLLHVGWKDVGERVRRAAEEVFNGVSLKTKLSAIDLHRLVADIRRRVEHEITFEGTERRTTFLSSLLPPTPETIYHVLTQGGYASAPDAHPSLLNPDTNFTLTDFQSEGERAQRDRQHTHYASMASATSSQLSHVFEHSPALAISAHPQRTAGPSYLTPPRAPAYAGLLDAPFIALLDETRHILASPDFAHVLEVSLDRATEVLFEGLEKNVFLTAGGAEGEAPEGGERIRLAGLLPGLARWSQLALEGLPNELVDKILDQREVGCLSAITFARFEERFE